MKVGQCTRFAVAFAGALITTAAPVCAQGSYVDPYALKNREPGKAVVREGDMSVGAAIRTDERYNNIVFNGPRGWTYWNKKIPSIATMS